MLFNTRFSKWGVNETTTSQGKGMKLEKSYQIAFPQDLLVPSAHQESRHSNYNSHGQSLQFEGTVHQCIEKVRKSSSIENARTIKVDTYRVQNESPNRTEWNNLSHSNHKQLLQSTIQYCCSSRPQWLHSRIPQARTVPQRRALRQSRMVVAPRYLLLANPLPYP